jgi:hypothetical protein
VNPDKSIVEFLCRDENLSLAIEVAEAIDAVYERVEAEFLNLMSRALAEKFDARIHGGDWVLEKEVDEPSKTRRYAGVYISPRRNEAPHYLYYPLVVCREGAEFYLYYGLEWWGTSDEQPKEFPTNESSPLVAFLDEREFKRSRWTLGWKTVATFTDRGELLLSLHQRGKELATTAVQDLLGFFEATVGMVSATNTSLARAISRK